MKLWRLDSVHEQDLQGAFCLFFREEVDARIQEQRLMQLGWMTDVYLDDLGPVPPWQAARVVGVPWPLAPSAFVGEQLEFARQQESRA